MKFKQPTVAALPSFTARLHPGISSRPPRCVRRLRVGSGVVGAYRDLYFARTMQRATIAFADVVPPVA